MKVVLDTNVLVSGLLFRGVPGCMLTAWSTGTLRLVISPPILEEHRRVGLALSRGREPLVGTLEALLAMLTVHALLVDAPPLDERVSEDPDDAMCFAAAVAANARLIVSGDKHLLRVSGWRGIEIVKARPFVDRYLEPADIERNAAADSAMTNGCEVVSPDRRR
ncbi:putative toxin-antitoxin system toxin component, PIN family [Gemmatimonas sp.]|uniref:putative toxin-antitoxin system toxin component, PIN family n=1 Tax=Gemmatimonas sp. TaxID=1962908 RepID=UPI00391F2D22